MHPLEAMASAFIIDKYNDPEAWKALQQYDKDRVMGSIRAALTALAAANLSDDAKRAGSPFRFGGEEHAETTFKAVIQHIVEEGKQQCRAKQPS